MKAKKHSFFRNYSQVILVLFALMIVLFFSASCQPKVFKVGILSGADPLATVGEGFIAKMTELGYIEGKNITYDFQKMNPGQDKEKPVLEKFIKDKVDLVLAYPAGASLIAKEVLGKTKIPLLFDVAVVEGSNLVNSIREPGNNLTGVRVAIPENAARRLDIFSKILSGSKRIYIAYDKNYPSVPPTLERLYEAVKSTGVTLVETVVTAPDQIVLDLNERAKQKDIGIDAILMLSESNNTAAKAGILEFGQKYKIPVSGNDIPSIYIGALFAIGTDLSLLGKLAAPLADKILKGTPAGTIPVVSPDEDLHINLKVAEQLGLTIPESILSTAVEIVK